MAIQVVVSTEDSAQVTIDPALRFFFSFIQENKEPFYFQPV